MNWVRFDRGFAFRIPPRVWIGAQADGGFHHLIPVHMELAIFIGSRVYDFGVKRNTDKRLFAYGPPETNTDWNTD